jgi:hypothetical protein
MIKNKREQFLMIEAKDFILLSNRLKPRDVLMFLHFKAMVDWDIRHKNYNTVRKTVREIKAERLPTWSIGKIWSAKKILLAEGLLVPVDRCRVRLNEKKVLYPELNVPITEQSVQEAGQNRIDEIKGQISDIVKKWHIS